MTTVDDNKNPCEHWTQSGCSNQLITVELTHALYGGANNTSTWSLKALAEVYNPMKKLHCMHACKQFFWDCYEATACPPCSTNWLQHSQASFSWDYGIVWLVSVATVKSLHLLENQIWLLRWINDWLIDWLGLYYGAWLCQELLTELTKCKLSPQIKHPVKWCKSGTLATDLGCLCRGQYTLPQSTR